VPDSQIRATPASRPEQDVHRRPDPFAENAFEPVMVDLSQPERDVVSLSRSFGEDEHTRRVAQQDTEETNLA
jgi:hypothetical protein